MAKLLTGLNNRITQTVGMEARLGHAFLWSVTDLGQLQAVLVEQIIPQLMQATGGQEGTLQYIFRDEQQPLRARFIHDSHASINNSVNDQVNASSQNPLFTGQNAFFGQSMSTAGYKINADLIAGIGEFAKPSVYQRLYP